VTGGPFGLDGQRALVPGASKAIGAAIAVGLAEAGADVMLRGRSEASLAETAAACRGGGADVELVARDLSNPDAVAEAAQEVAASTEVDILVNHAATISRAPVRESTFEDAGALRADDERERSIRERTPPDAGAPRTTSSVPSSSSRVPPRGMSTGTC
jgi:NAD(P)-dependent dehydrogenase (short-subunit alcohol dehydrogenase family)